jgi:CubicO group peptidase (beta-lactamase class C family)
MASVQPPRWTQPPGAHWYYNNWDFNVLGIIFEKLTGKNIFEEFERRIAGPIGMQDFTVSDGIYQSGPEPIHRQYIFSTGRGDIASDRSGCDRNDQLGIPFLHVTAVRSQSAHSPSDEPGNSFRKHGSGLGIRIGVRAEPGSWKRG